MVLGKVDNGLHHVQKTTPNRVAANQGSLVLHSGDQQACSQSLLKQNFSFSDLESWHFRLGHLSFDKMKLVDLPCNRTRTDNICSICPKARLHRQPFPLSHSRATRIFELIHVDI